MGMPGDLARREKTNLARGDARDGSARKNVVRSGLAAPRRHGSFFFEGEDAGEVTGIQYGMAKRGHSLERHRTSAREPFPPPSKNICRPLPGRYAKQGHGEVTWNELFVIYEQNF